MGRPTPTIGTPRRPERPTTGGEVARVAQLLGKPLLPWQRYVADVAGEFDPVTGLPFYGEVRLMVPRQSGKTELILAEAVQANLMDPSGATNVVYTAQDRNKARKRWEDRFLADIASSPLAELMLKPRMINGNEAIRWRNGSMFGIDAVKKDSGHGETLDRGFVDEAFAHEDTRVEAAMLPAMATRARSQLWVSSAAGTHESLYFWEKVQAGREIVRSGGSSTIAYFEWSAPLDADPDDVDAWYECMPALGHLITVEKVRGFRDSSSDADFRRGFLSQFSWEAKGSSPIPAAQWKRCSHTNYPGPDGEPVELADDAEITVGIDTTPGRERTALSVAGWVVDDQVYLSELAAHDPGTDWVVERVIAMDSRRRVARVVIDGRGAAGTLEQDLRRHFGDRLLVTGPRDMARACGLVYDDTMGARGLHRDNGSPYSLALNAAVEGARKRSLGDAWAFNRQDSKTDISPLVSRTLARWGLADLLDSVSSRIDPLSQIF